MSTKRALASMIALAVAALPACSSDDSGGTVADVERPEPAEQTTTTVERPEGPVATVVEELTGGKGVSLAAAASGPDLAELGWTEAEYALEGTATSYRSEGELPQDGTFTLAEDEQAEYRTRIVVRRPPEEDFNGTVVVEWLNVSAGFDANPDFAYTAEELARGGYAWVGVSAQHIGIEGGAVAVSTPVSEAAGAGRGLRANDPERYGELHHPGDAFSYDIYTQVARTLRAPGELDPLGDLEPERLLAVGESQSGFALTTYLNGVQPLALQYDGFLVHSRGGAAAPLGEPEAGIDIAATIGLPPTKLRTDLDTPVLIVETETDVVGILNYLPARQPDSEHLRLWEIAGTAHADAHILGPVADLLECPAPVNAGGHHFVVKAALRRLDEWVRGEGEPPAADRLQVDETPAFVRDANGNALGGVRTPQVDVPLDTLSGDPAPGGSVACLLFGQTLPLPEEQLRELYGSPDAYLDAYTDAADEAINAGFVLPEDRDALLAAAQPSRIPA